MKFFYDDQYPILYECEDCGEIIGTSGEEIFNCPNCNSEGLLVETNQEGMECANEGCTNVFDVWERTYYSPDTGEYYCEVCARELGEQNE